MPRYYFSSEDHCRISTTDFFQAKSGWPLWSTHPRSFTKPLRWRLILHCYSALLQNLDGNSCLGGVLSALRKLNNRKRQVVMFLLLLFKLSSQFPFVSFSFLSISILSLLPFLISPSLSTIPSFPSDQFSALLR